MENGKYYILPYQQLPGILKDLTIIKHTAYMSGCKSWVVNGFLENGHKIFINDILYKHIDLFQNKSNCIPWDLLLV